LRQVDKKDSSTTLSWNAFDDRSYAKKQRASLTLRYELHEELESSELVSKAG
jgi:hypothetical protein